jgi:hypothetical protein
MNTKNRLLHHLETDEGGATMGRVETAARHARTHARTHACTHTHLSLVVLHLFRGTNNATEGTNDPRNATRHTTRTHDGNTRGRVQYTDTPTVSTNPSYNPIWTGNCGGLAVCLVRSGRCHGEIMLACGYI